MAIKVMSLRHSTKVIVSFSCSKFSSIVFLFLNSLYLADFSLKKSFRKINLKKNNGFVFFFKEFLTVEVFQYSILVRFEEIQKNFPSNCPY